MFTIWIGILQNMCILGEIRLKGFEYLFLLADAILKFPLKSKDRGE